VTQLEDDRDVTQPEAMTRPRRVALVTGVGRRIGIGAAAAERLARDGFDVGFTYWTPYDDRMPWGANVINAGANLVSFLCSDGGAWINGQLLYSNGGVG
jgi:hypothetical protein